MKIKKIVTAAVIFAPVLSGCETMMTHYTMGETTLNHIARGNAMVNVCQAYSAINKNVAFGYSSVSAQLLDVSVVDRDAYKRAYDSYLASASADTSSIYQHCGQLEQGLPKVTNDYAELYSKIVRDLSLARAQEQQEMAVMLRNFGSNWTRPVAPVTYSWPHVSYSSSQLSPGNYLVKTSNGMLNCRMTDKNFVFCL